LNLVLCTWLCRFGIKTIHVALSTFVFSVTVTFICFNWLNSITKFT
jgi:hypothetical protein